MSSLETGSGVSPGQAAAAQCSPGCTSPQSSGDTELRGRERGQGRHGRAPGRESTLFFKTSTLLQSPGPLCCIIKSISENKQLKTCLLKSVKWGQGRMGLESMGG